MYKPAIIICNGLIILLILWWQKRNSNRLQNCSQCHRDKITPISWDFNGKEAINTSHNYLNLKLKKKDNVYHYFCIFNFKNVL